MAVQERDNTAFVTTNNKHTDGGAYEAQQYTQSLEFYERQYREKLRDLETERRARAKLEENLSIVESSFRETLEDNARLQATVDECVRDNKLMGDHLHKL